MTVDEIVAHYIKANHLSHPEDIGVMREMVEEIVGMYETPHRWSEADGFQSPE